MEKVILANGQEFELVANGVREERDNAMTFVFIPGANTIEQLMGMWKDNATITVKNGETSIQVYSNYTKFSKISVDPDYYINSKPVCPECGKDVAIDAKECECKAQFEAPTMKDIRGTVCTVTVCIPDINDRMNDVESSVEVLINSALV